MKKSFLIPLIILSSVLLMHCSLEGAKAPESTTKMLLVCFDENGGFAGLKEVKVALEAVNPEGEKSGLFWGQCTNAYGSNILVYGPKGDDGLNYDNSIYILPNGQTTPSDWDCDGFYLPTNREYWPPNAIHYGQKAVKFSNWRDFTVHNSESHYYASDTERGWAYDDGVFGPGQINWWIPDLSQETINSW